MISFKRPASLAFYVFLIFGFFVLVMLTLKIVVTQLSFFGFDHGDLLSLKNKIFGKEESVQNYDQIIFVGDVMLARHVERLMERNGDDYPFTKIDLKMNSDSALVGNFEASVPKIHQPTPDYKLSFSVREKHLPLLRSFGFTHFSLANNHSYDHGSDGYKNTMLKLQESGLTGFGHPVRVATSSVAFISVAEQKIAIIALHTLFSPSSPDDLREVFEFANSQSDQQIVYVHWGEEYKLRPNESQQKLAKLLVDLGADLIVGHHPHVVQGIEEVGGVPVFYSLGNFIFDQYFSKDVREGLVLVVRDDNGLKVDIRPVFSYSNSSQPEFMQDEQKKAFLKSLSERSSKHLAEQITEGHIDNVKELASFQKTVIIAE